MPPDAPAQCAYPREFHVTTRVLSRANAARGLLDLVESHVAEPTNPTVEQPYDTARRVAAVRGARVTAWCAITLVPTFAYLDTILFPEQIPLFLYWRAATIAVAALVVLMLMTAFGRRHALLLAVMVPIVIGLDVDAMTMIAGREQSPYYVGIILVLLAASLLLPWPPSWAFVTSFLLIVLYVAGVPLTGPLSDFPLFLTNALLLATSGVLVVVGAAMNERLRRREFDAGRQADAHARRQETVATLGQVGLSGVGSSMLIKRTAELVAATLDADACEVLEIGPSGTLHLRAGFGVSLEDEPLACGAAAGYAATALASPEAIVITGDDSRDGRLLAELGVSGGVMSVIGGRDHAFGLLAVYTRQRATFTNEEIDFLEAVAAILSTALVREQAESALTEEVETSAALARVARALISWHETPVLAERLCELTADVLDAEYSSTWVFEDGSITPIASYGLAADHWEALRPLKLPISSFSDLIEALRADELFYLRPHDERYPLLGRLVTEHGGTLCLLMGLRRGDTLNGVQVIGYRGRTTELTAQETRLAHGIAQLASMALTNAALVEELERASRLKSEFMSTMSHELRTPLNVIIGYTEMLGDDPPPDDRDHALAQVRHSSLELLELIEATLDLNRIAAGKDVLHVETVDVSALCAELRADFAGLARRSTVEVRWEITPTELRTDRRKLKIVLKNLIGNALKFTAEGEVAVRGITVDGGYALAVRDTGIGIPAEHLPVIFEMFRQVDASDARSYSGAGLGLYIVRRLVDQLQGTIEVASEPGRGSTFTVRLRLDIDATPERDGAAKHPDHAVGF